MAHIVAADDDDDILQLIGWVLRAAGHEVVLAADGREALASIACRTPDIVLLDLQMPEMTGLSTLNAIRDDPLTRSLPVVVVTAYDDDAKTSACEALGVVDYIVKPFSPRALVARVDELLRELGVGPESGHSRSER